MNRLTKEYLQSRLEGPLPGLDSHLKMAPENRAEALRKKDAVVNAKKSAVMILLFHEADVLKMIVIRRSQHVGVHAGQIAFPGGRYEESDVDILETAFREIEEEIGIPRKKINLLGRLSDIYVPPSNFLISVFVGYLPEKPVYIKQESEVAEILEIPFSEFYKPELVQQKEFFVSSTKTNVVAPYFNISNAEIWGASAMVISELLDTIGK